jgi:eukaryotic-like serine/threonine-protein kinase
VLQLAEYTLQAPVGRGGMAEVWSGHAQSQPVAIKVLNDAASWAGPQSSRLQQEVRAVAALHHPAIIRVYDHGVVSPEDDARSEGRLTAGCPYLVMELADRGTLGSPRSFAELHGVLAALLDALAHAHARGVLHRDLKPSNVLCTSGPHPLRLADFGVAHVMRDKGPDGPPVGTPPYMAPEQILGDWRSWGPWTDLYALGCLGWRLATGRSPFGGPSITEVLERQLRSEPPAFRPRGPLPAGFEGWLRMLLRKSPHERIATAADAAHALDQIPGVWEERQPWRGGASSRPAKRPMPDTHLVAQPDSESTRFLQRERPRGPISDSGGWHPDRRPPLPDWRVPKAPTAALPALGLFGVRVPPLVGRVAEREQLWAALREVAGGGVRAMLLEGPSGVGKSRLARWLVERSHEVGAAVGWQARLAKNPGPQHGLGPMVERYLRCEGLGRDGVHKRVERWWNRHARPDPEEVDALVELVRPVDTQQQDEQGTSRAVPRPGGTRLAGRAHRLDTVVRLVAAAARLRPLILWLDDLHCDDEGPGLVAALLQAAERRRLHGVLVLGTSVSPGSEQTRALDPAVTRVPLGALPPTEAAELVAGLLALEGGVAQAVAERAGGNALYAVQLVGDLVQRRALVRGPAGFRTRDGARPTLPDDLHGLWTARTETVLASRPPEDRFALQVIAALGTASDWTEIRSVLTHLGLELSEGLIDGLADQGLLRVEPRGVRFVHGLLRESLCREARESKRWTEINLAIANVLRQIAGPLAAAREAEHLIEAGALTRALGPLLEAAHDARARGAHRQMATLCTRRLGVLNTLGVGEEDERRGECLWLIAASVRKLGDLQGADDRLADLLTRCARHGWLRLWSIASVERADLMQTRGQYAQALQLLDEASERAAMRRERATQGEAENTRGWITFKMGQIAPAIEHFEKAIGWIDPHSYRSLDPRVGRAMVLCNQGHFDEAEQHYRDLLSWVVERGWVPARGNMIAELGRVARGRGDLQGALDHFRRAEDLYDRLASANLKYIGLASGSCLVEMGRFEEAVEVLEPLAEQFRAASQPDQLSATRVSLLCCRAALAQWPAFHRELAAVRDHLLDTPLRDKAFPIFVERAGDLAAAVGGPAEQAYQLAAVLWARLDQPSQAVRVLAKLD